MAQLIKIHAKYLAMCESKGCFGMEMLWVPGLEPRDGHSADIGELRDAPPGMAQEIFSAEEMYMRHGERRGVLLAEIQDRKGWQRRLWDLPRGKIEGTVAEIPSELVTRVTSRKDTRTGQMVLTNVAVSLEDDAVDMIMESVEGNEIDVSGTVPVQQVEGESTAHIKMKDLEEDRRSVRDSEESSPLSSLASLTRISRKK